MQALTAPLKKLEAFEDIKALLKKQKTAAISGCADSQKLHLFNCLTDGFRYKVIVTYSEEKAAAICEEYRFYDKSVCLLPEKDLIFFEADVHGDTLVAERIKVLRRIYEKKPTCIVTTLPALMTLQPVWEDKDILRIEKDSVVSEEALSKKLLSMGYEKVYQVEKGGQFSIRGGIVDIFDLTEENPVRIELWGDEVESIRIFDTESQRSGEKLYGITIFPATEFVLSKGRIDKGIAAIQTECEKRVEYFKSLHETEHAHTLKKRVNEFCENLADFMSYSNFESYAGYFYENLTSLADLIYQKLESDNPQSLVYLFDEPLRVEEHGTASFEEFRMSTENRLLTGYILPGQANMISRPEEVIGLIDLTALATMSGFEAELPSLEVDMRVTLKTRSVNSYNNSFELLIKDLSKYKKEGYLVLLLSPSKTRAERLTKDIKENGIPCAFSQDPFRTIVPGEVLVTLGNIKTGFEYEDIKFVVLSESDIFTHYDKKNTRKKRYNEGRKINDFNELHIGDYVVHEYHGLGIYRGIQEITVDGVQKDYLKVEYRDGGNLYVSVTSLDVIQKYASMDSESVPKLNRLGSKDWEKTKLKVKEAVWEIATDLVELYAKRDTLKGHPFGHDTVWQKEFEELFPYEETYDQQKAIEDTKRDMESERIMDRLICGDVGFGKTEVAIRAAFKAVQDSKQVAILVPTTILASQHFNTFRERMKDYPVGIEMLNRLKTPAEQRKIIAGLKNGSVDIVIGTHRLLSKDIAFKDLGLLIIDEEQRFGVSHKEKIKKLKNNVDVLTLTATPIPRTLHMSLSGIRDMSLLEEAPHDRKPIQTFVCEYNEILVREAIMRELKRGGQVYYVYNRVKTIPDVCAALQRLVPEARISYAHGKMEPRELEAIMYDFVTGNIDVLISTTIIETGMDISNVNTMIIHDSDTLGLSQLYQLRGRVGRSTANAYAFLMYKRDKLLKEVAEKRLEAIKEFTRLGSGFKIAMKDLEIRGAGNLLGTSQHGHMAAVGYDLYCKMLNEAVSKVKGDIPKDNVIPSSTVDLDVDAFIPGEYIFNEVAKLDIYKRIAQISDIGEKDDMEQELKDRFGEVPVSVINLLRIALIKAKACEVYVTEIKGIRGKIVFTFAPVADINVAAIPSLLSKYKNSLTFSAATPCTLTYKYIPAETVSKNDELLLSSCEKVIEDMKEYLTGD
ncbi:MAG: transcription-repair coupling factor [Lachnospiraceae bacterium]|nr:transcription-repair coupling factor [Lachnospiraceae bacterium]